MHTGRQLLSGAPRQLRRSGLGRSGLGEGPGEREKGWVEEEEEEEEAGEAARVQREDVEGDRSTVGLREQSKYLCWGILVSFIMMRLRKSTTDIESAARFMSDLGSCLWLPFNIWQIQLATLW